MKNNVMVLVLAVAALVLALVAILEVVKPWVALGLAVMCLALAVLLPSTTGLGGRDGARDGRA